MDAHGLRAPPAWLQNTSSSTNTTSSPSAHTGTLQTTNDTANHWITGSPLPPRSQSPASSSRSHGRASPSPASPAWGEVEAGGASPLPPSDSLASPAWGAVESSLPPLPPSPSARTASPAWGAEVPARPLPPPPPPPPASPLWGSENSVGDATAEDTMASSSGEDRSPHFDPRDRDVPYAFSHNGHPGYHRGRLRQAAEDNVPNRFELFLLGDGEKKVTETPDTRVPNASVFVFNKEDHTLGNVLRARLLQSPHIRFSGYRVPHPLFSSFELRVQTDGTLTPRAAVVQACRDLVNDLGTLSREFTKEWELRKMAGEGATAPER